MSKTLILILAFIGLALAFSPNADAAVSVPSDVHLVRGKITEVMPAKHSVVVTRKNGSKRIVRVNQDTKIRVDGQPATFADLAIGQRVRAVGKLGPNGHVLVAKRLRAKN